MTDDLQSWIGRTQRVTDQVTRPTMQRLAATLDLPADGHAAGSAIPQAWYAVLFGPLARHSALGPDGHPAKGDFLPPVALPRRLFAGRRVSFHAPLRIGDEVERVSEIARIEAKPGRSGAMTFVTLVHRITGPAGLAVTEEQDLVYRGVEQAAGGAPRDAAPPDLPAPDWQRTLTPDPVLLFRYSALTFNGHRIHYDADYTRAVEGYPACVVNGGLTALLLLELARHSLERRFAAVSTRNLKPLYVDRPITLCGARGGDWWVLDDAGALALRATVQ